MTHTGGFQDDDFWTEFHDFLFSEQRHAQAEQLLDTSPLLSFPAGARVLDLCCGPGVFTVPLARRGFDVTGVDLSPAMLERARKRTADAGAEVTYVRADARAYEAPGSFDVVLNMFTSFGYFEDPADNARVLRTMYTALRPGGTLVLDLAGKELLAGRVTPPKVVRRGDDVLVQTDTVLDDWARLRSDWVLVRGGRVTRATLVWFVYSAVELRRMAQEAGFGRVEVFGGFDGRPYDENAERLVLRAVRE
ncbi:MULTISPECIES: class I SAM-dependent methyltransferase [Streptomyces]|uniref:Methyltransferase n=1 Tax=Streptomyces fradiae ATCC 10745 = DSM 40063 TaxID=1319510 RepID=A0A1Y2P1P7_STRFR|nr:MULTISPECIES: class I SAM-dependent methyltransferase [Streptomyces]KAF0647939.1 methyltransferase [Streptomyces fradiae ATCC 10745 = DSM 40063]OSY53098.1 Ubiquinone biosynthesis O-methyltransferase [Streptomyces fradiae ATCC 10745 = DSM 40063]QEV14558.1 class I SAM-dependent methyltransferase [Streptomyces fradiae ATCC 10745 = DSM 40063]UQS29372.1 class I SAM-dependent methyltransferase [Streptomyces fradiae]